MKYKKSRVHVIYRGRVQGVGFRWNVTEIVREFKLTGFVKNLSDGTVELLLEGKENEIDDAILLIDRRMQRFWKTRDIQTLEGLAHYSKFLMIQ